MRWTRSFTEHPASVGETYFEHQCRAFRLVRRLLVVSMAAVVHGLVPDLFKTHTSDKISEIHNELHDLSQGGAG